MATTGDPLQPAGTGRQPAPMNRPPAQPLGIGVQPGTPNIIRARQVIVFGSGPNSGIFVYSPAPGPGNLIAAIAGADGTDPYGNAYKAVFSAGTIGNNYSQIDPAGDLLLYSAGTVNIALNPAKEAMFIYAPSAGAGNLIAAIAASSGTDQFGNVYPNGVSTNNGTIQQALFGNALSWDNLVNPVNVAQPAIFANPSGTLGNRIEVTTGEGVVAAVPAALTFYDSTIAPTTSLVPSGTAVIAVASTSPVLMDNYHSLGSPGITNLTTDAGRYRFDNQGEVEIDINCHATAAIASTTGTFAQALPAAYRPAFDRTYPLGQPIASDASGRISISSSTGVVSLHIPALNNGNIIGNTFSMPVF